VVQRQPAARRGSITEPVSGSELSDSYGANPNPDPNATTRYADSNPNPDYDAYQNRYPNPDASLPDQYAYRHSHGDTYAAADQAPQPQQYAKTDKYEDAYRHLRLSAGHQYTIAAIANLHFGAAYHTSDPMPDALGYGRLSLA
jgi:hypothetical protein